MNNSEFSSLNLSPALQENLTSLGYLQMTPIQASIVLFLHTASPPTQTEASIGNP